MCWTFRWLLWGQSGGRDKGGMRGELRRRFLEPDVYFDGFAGARPMHEFSVRRAAAASIAGVTFTNGLKVEAGAQRNLLAANVFASHLQLGSTRVRARASSEECTLVLCVLVASVCSLRRFRTPLGAEGHPPPPARGLFS